MIQNLSELREFIIWAKEQKVKAIKVGDISFELSDLAIVEEISKSTDFTDKKPVGFDSRTLAETEQTTAKDDDDLLFWSTKP